MQKTNPKDAAVKVALVIGAMAIFVVLVVLCYQHIESARMSLPKQEKISHSSDMVSLPDGIIIAWLSFRENAGLCIFIILLFLGARMTGPVKVKK